MKLKYILPVATIASVAAVATPLVTSCAKTWEYSWNFVKKGEYKSTVDPLTGDPLTETAATNKYFTDIGAKKKIIANDFLMNRNEAYKSMETTFGDDLKKCTTMLNINHIDATNHLLSFRYRFETSYPDEDEPTGFTEGVIDIECKDIVFSAHYYEDEDGSYWNLEPTVLKLIEEGKTLDEVIAELNEHSNWLLKGDAPFDAGEGSGGNSTFWI